MKRERYDSLRASLKILLAFVLLTIAAPSLMFSISMVAPPVRPADNAVGPAMVNSPVASPVQTSTPTPPPGTPGPTPTPAAPTPMPTPTPECGDRWTATPLGASLRTNHTAIWTGSKMIVYAGDQGELAFLDGWLYDPGTNSWASTNPTNAPMSRTRHTAIWTGSEMIVWGGYDWIFSVLNTGGKYNPVMNTWAATSATNAPTAREDHTAVWTGGEMIVWGGFTGLGGFQTGGWTYPFTSEAQPRWDCAKTRLFCHAFHE